LAPVGESAAQLEAHIAWGRGPLLGLAMLESQILFQRRLYTVG